MPMMTRDEIFEKIKGMLPSDARVTDERFEGANVVVFSENAKFVAGSTETIKKIAKEVKKRIDVRAAPSLVMRLEEAERKIRKLLPEDTGITSIDFDAGASKVLIEAEKPSNVIGKAGETLIKIKQETFWTPEVFRTPPMKSDIISTIRRILIKRGKERATFLNKVGNRIYTGTKEPKWVRITALGGYREVGRSCMLLQTPESRILFDCGVNVASEENAFPLLESPDFDISKLDAVVISHAHMDHVGLLPLLFKYGYRGPVYCTAPTRPLMALLQLDSIDIAQAENKKPAFSSTDIHEEILHTITLNYGEVTDITPDIRITFYEAGHIIGSTITHVHVGDGVYNLVYSGDIKYAKTRLLDPAWNQFPRCEALIIESTYGAGGDIQPPIARAEEEVVRIIKETIARGGKLLIPVLGVGRSQEIMLLLEELVRKGELSADIPVYLDGMMWDATAIYTTYPEFLSERVRNQIFSRDENPLLSKIFRRVGSRKEREALIAGPPCVIMATSGMMTGGPSVEYFKNLADSDLNSIMFINYQAEGSLGKKVQRGMRQIPMTENHRREPIDVRIQVHTVEGFSAHADRNQLMNFIGDMHSKPEVVIVQHGENSKCVDLMRSVHKAFRIESIAPRNLEAVRLR